ncbi:hypothetical protein SAMN04488564_11914 [Lentzea waywayandensis]|uniref:Uncharacterized protein n=1 Tax=Lentzea waywayandensis TaxID=84724 RepID=A0A1I6FHF3_9PSEU|nr:hypothetical protein [Lentzea waywayandensis]SFR29373.1 hypothetical protein SAMN04488564_11914 [Lentzea waywayandensis]
MTGVRRRGYFTAAVAVMGAALVAALFAAPPDKPVDIRLVAPPPPPPEVITATATTTMSAIGAERPPPPPPPPPGAHPPPRHRPDHRPPPPPRPAPGTPGAGLFDLLRCDSTLFGEELKRCLEWPMSDEFCDLLKKYHLQPVDLRGPDGKPIDLKCDKAKP